MAARTLRDGVGTFAWTVPASVFANTTAWLSSASCDADAMKFVFSKPRTGPPSVPSKIRRCCGGLVAANAFFA